MRIVFAGHNPRGVACLRAVTAAGHDVPLVVVHPGAEDGAVATAAREGGIDVQAPADVNDAAVVAAIAELAPEAVVLAGFGPIVRSRCSTRRRTAASTCTRGSCRTTAGRLP